MSKRASLFLLPVIYLGYISLGLPDGTLGVAWPSMQTGLGLPFDLAGQMMLLITLLAMGSSVGSGALIRRFKTGPVVMISCAMTGSALLLISQAQGVSWLLLAALPLGMGAGAVDSGLNGFVARHYSRRHMNWLHACWGIGATCGPLIMTQTIKVGYGWSGGFFVIASAQLTLAFVFLATLGLWDRQPEAVPSVLTETSDTSSVRRLHALQSPAAWLSFGVFALYVAVESSAGLWANSVLVLSRQVPQATAGLCVTAYYGSITVGRILVGFAPARWANRRLVLGGALLAVAGTSLLMLGKAPVFALPALVMMGLGFAPIFPGLMHEAPRRFVPEAVQSIIGRQGACAYSGAAFAPALAGWIAVRSTLESIPVFLFVGVLALAFCVWVLDRLCRA